MDDGGDIRLDRVIIKESLANVVFDAPAAQWLHTMLLRRQSNDHWNRGFGAGRKEQLN